MATKSFLTGEDLDAAAGVLKAPSVPPDGDERRGTELGARAFSHWLGERLAARLSAHADWLGAEPVILGSWARDELCPKSDIDLLFLGPEECVRRLVSDFAREGLKLRSRVPEDPQDWTKGVQPFDVLALHSAVPVGENAREKLRGQLDRLASERRRFRSELLRAMRVERKARAERYDSISNFLEPNLKFGPGGLRDLDQALAARMLFPDRFEGEDHAFEVLRYYKSFFLLVRAKLHLSAGATDVLSAAEQKPIADWLGYKNPKDFMREVQKGLSRVSFYADWAIARAACSRARLEALESRKLNTVASLFDALEEDPSTLMQHRVRVVADQVFKKAGKVDGRMIGRRLQRLLDPATSEEPLVALFRSRLIDHCVPDYRKVVGYVQHDQYHRFTVDAHLLQVLRELKRLRRSPSRAGRLAKVARSLTGRDWMILAFGCLYHDLAKGRGGDHAAKGVELARRDLERFGKDQASIREITWIVEEHLGLSAAAFRENPRSPRTWRGLRERGVKGQRIARLAVFTIVDIKGTNPEAWTPWKERLLFDLVNQLERPETDTLMGFGEALRAKKIRGWDRYLEELDPFLISAVPARVLAEDLALAMGRGKKIELPPAVVQMRGGKQTWIRFHASEDRPGLFLGFVKWLSASGLGVRHASIRTDPQLGIYDWFEVKTTKGAADISKRLEAAAKQRAEKTFHVRFDAIELVTHDEHEWVISFRGRDQAGALMEAARALFEANAEIRWAKVHTWGRQIDDVFGIAPRADVKPDSLIAELLSRLGPEALGEKEG